MSFVRCHVSGITCQVSGEGVGGFFVCLLVKVPLMAVLAAEKKKIVATISISQEILCLLYAVFFCC